MMRWTRFGSVALGSVLVLGACAAAEDVWGGRTPTRETLAVQEAAVRWIVQHYEPADYLGDPKAYCLVVGQPRGNRERDAMRISARTSEWDPPQTLLTRLARVEPRIVPISDCTWGDDLSEVLRSTGERAIALGVQHPSWVTPNVARFRVSLRENSRKSFSYSCSAERQPEGWVINKCT